MSKTVDKWLGRRIIFYTFLIMFSLVVRTWAAGTQVGSFAVSPNAAHGMMVWEAPDVTTLAVGTNGQIPVGSTGADPVFATVGTGTGISTTTGAGTLTINNTGVTSAVAGTAIGVSGSTGAVTISNTGVTSAVAGTGISVSGATGAVTISATGGGTRTVTAKTTSYSVLSGDSGTFFTNTGAAGTVNFTLPTASAGFWCSVYTDAVQTVTITAPASTTIKMGGTTSASAGNVTNAVAGNCITLIAISSTQYVAIGYTGSWTVN